MTRPLSNADTIFMPELYPATEPFAVVVKRGNCAWCDIALAAIPDPPKPVFAPDGNIVHTHPGGCTSAFRQVVDYRPDAVSSTGPGPSDPR